MTMPDSMWWKRDERLPSRAAHRASARPKRRKCRPSLDPLEGRWTPAVFTVTTPLDNGAGPAVSLREAVRMANQAPGPDTINFAANLARKTINLTHGSLRISDDLTIDGPAQSITIDANDTSRIFQVERNGGPNITVRMNDLRLVDGHTSGKGGAIVNQENLTLDNVLLASNVAIGLSSSGGGAIFNDGGKLTLQNCSFRQNRSHIGGALSNYKGQVTIASTDFTRNSCETAGGAVNNNGSMTLDRVKLSSNVSKFFGGAVALADGTLSVTDSTIAHNRAAYAGGITAGGGTLTVAGTTLSGNDSIFLATAIEGRQSTITLINSTVGNNGEGSFNGPALSAEGGSLTLRNVTVAGPRTRAITFNGGATLTLNNSIVTSKVENGGGTLLLQDKNLVQDGSVTGPGVITGDPLLGPLTANGGPTLTFLPRAGSPAIDAGGLEGFAVSTLFDQRGPGFGRIAGGKIDLGAVEMQE